MKTLLVGDLHLKAQLILPNIVEEAIEKLGCKRVIRMGDYMDEYKQQNNTKLLPSIFTS